MCKRPALFPLEEGSPLPSPLSASQGLLALLPTALRAGGAEGSALNPHSILIPASSSGPLQASPAECRLPAPSWRYPCPAPPQNQSHVSPLASLAVGPHLHALQHSQHHARGEAPWGSANASASLSHPGSSSSGQSAFPQHLPSSWRTPAQLKDSGGSGNSCQARRLGTSTASPRAAEVGSLGAHQSRPSGEQNVPAAGLWRSRSRTRVEVLSQAVEQVLAEFVPGPSGSGSGSTTTTSTRRRPQPAGGGVATEVRGNCSAGEMGAKRTQGLHLAALSLVREMEDGLGPGPQGASGCQGVKRSLHPLVADREEGLRKKRLKLAALMLIEELEDATCENYKREASTHSRTSKCTAHVDASNSGRKLSMASTYHKLEQQESKKVLISLSSSFTTEGTSDDFACSDNTMAKEATGIKEKTWPMLFGVELVPQTEVLEDLTPQ